jgi:hypothetical protein
MHLNSRVLQLGCFRPRSGHRLGTFVWMLGYGSNTVGFQAKKHTSRCKGGTTCAHESTTHALDSVVSCGGKND